MAFGTKKTVKSETPSFASRMSSIKSMFKTAHDNASKLKTEIEKEIENKNAQIVSLQSDIETINVTKKEAEEFMENISKFI
jgi:hypothetical protein|nr:MAG TPA: hypothetical protein [Caudoviricetes sp.]